MGEYRYLQEIRRKCPRCPKHKLFLLHLEIFDRGLHSTREAAFEKLRLRCDNCGEFNLESKIQCESCGKNLVSICMTKPLLKDGLPIGINYILRCKSCGYIWEVNYVSRVEKTIPLTKSSTL